MNPDGTHDNVWFDVGLVKRLGQGPDMMGQVGCSIDEVGAVQKGERIYEDGGDGRGDEQRCDDMTGGVRAIASAGSTKRMARGKSRDFGSSVDQENASAIWESEEFFVMQGTQHVHGRPGVCVDVPSKRIEEIPDHLWRASGTTTSGRLRTVTRKGGSS